MELKPDFNFEVDGIGKAIQQEAEKLKENFSPQFPNHSEMLEKLLNQLTRIDFAAYIYPEVRELEKLREAKNTLGPDGEPSTYPSFTEKQQARLEELENKKFKVFQKQQKVVIVDELQKAAIRNDWGLCQNNGSVYVYNGCYWKSMSKGELETFLGKAARKMGVNRIDAKECIFKAHLVAQFFSDAMLHKPLPVNGRVLINFQNGTLEINDGKQRFRSFQRSDFLTYQLPFAYDPEANAPLWEKFMDEVLPDPERQNVLAEFLGYIFVSIRRLKAEKALLLYGTGANGKSVVFEVLYALLGGSENVTGYSLSTLTNVDKGGPQRANIADKLLNYGSEISSRLDPNMVKALISGEPVEAKPLFIDPYMIEDYAKFIFNCNELPKDTEQTHAFFRRFLIIPFDVTIPEEKQDRQLPQRIIKTELSGVFNWVMKGLNRLLEQNAFTDCEAVRKQLERYRRESDSVRMFLEDRGYESSPEHSLLLKEVYIDYKSFCIDDTFKPVNKTNFKKRLEGIGILIEGRKNRVYLKQVSDYF